MLVTIVERKQDESGKWSYKVKDSDGVLVNSGDFMAEDRLHNSA